MFTYYGDKSAKILLYIYYIDIIHLPIRYLSQLQIKDRLYIIYLYYTHLLFEIMIIFAKNRTANYDQSTHLIHK